MLVLQAIVMASVASDQMRSVVSDLSLAGVRSYRGLAALAAFVVCCVLAIGVDVPPQAVSESASPAVFSAERALKHLAVIGREPHPVNSPAHNAVRDYILSELRKPGLSPDVQKSSAAGLPENIVCRLQSSGSGKAVLLVAHYDSVPSGPGADGKKRQPKNYLRQMTRMASTWPIAENCLTAAG